MKDICELMGVSRAGYYKWKKRHPAERTFNRIKAIETVGKVHEEHPSHGYRWVAAFIRQNLNQKISDNYVYKCFKHLGIRSETKHKKHYKPRKVKDPYPNLIFTTWDTVDRPRQVVVSDMTAFKFFYFYYELTFYFDVFTKEILTWRVAERRGSREQYIDGLKDIVELSKSLNVETILHTDQGSVYSSMAYNELIKDSNIVRSMSRAGKPTDNPVNESLNGWIKEELFMDFKIDSWKTREEFIQAIKKYVDYYNKMRPCFAIGYDIPTNYYNKFLKGEIDHKDTFSKRVLSEEPKFVQKRKKLAHQNDVSTFENENP